MGASGLPRMHSKRLVITGMAAAALVVGCKREASTGSGGPAADPNAIQLSILYGSEKKTWLDEQIKSFNASRTAIAGRPIFVAGKAIGSGEAMTAILSG